MKSILPVPGRASSPAFEDDAPVARGRGDAELPSPFGGGDTRPRGGIDASFGEIDLPLTSGPGAELPLTSGASLPSLTGSALPTIAGSGLPVVTGSSALPVPTGGTALPIPTGGSALPIPTGGSALPIPTGGTALPVPSGATSLPSAIAGGVLPIAQPTGLPVITQPGMPAVIQGATSLPSVGGSEFELEDDLGGGANPFDDSDRTAPADGAPHATPSAVDLDGPARGQVGDEADLVAAPMSVGRVRPAPATEAPPARRGNAGKIALAALVLVAIGGGSLALVPSMGPFGANFISDQLNAKAYAQSLEQLRAHVDAGFDEDTSAGATRGVEEAKQAQASRPRHKPTMSFAAYAALARSLRFGTRGDDAAYAKQLITQAGTEASPEKALATAANLAVSGDLPHAKEAAAAALAAAPADLDAASLAAEIELASKSKGAVAAWKGAVAIKATARTLFGLARAARAAGDDATAKDAAEKALKASPAHPGARILLATILWSKDNDEAGALAHLKKVTEDKAVRANASDAELVAGLHRARAHPPRAIAHDAPPSGVRRRAQARSASGRGADRQRRALLSRRSLLRGARALRGGHAAPTRRTCSRRSAREDVPRARADEGGEGSPQEAAHAAQPEGPARRCSGSVAPRRRSATRRTPRPTTPTRSRLGDKSLEVVDAYVALAHLLTRERPPEEAAKQARRGVGEVPRLAGAPPRQGRGRARRRVSTRTRRSELRARARKGGRPRDALQSRRGRATPPQLRRPPARSSTRWPTTDKDFPGLALERGLLFEEMGQSDKALEMYNAALKKAPNDLDLKLRVGSTQVIAGHAEHAEKILREVVEGAPELAPR